MSAPSVLCPAPFRFAAALLLAAGLCACPARRDDADSHEQVRGDVAQLQKDLERLRESTARPPTLTLLDAEAQLNKRMETIDTKLDRLAGEHAAAFARLSARLSELERRLPVEPAPAAAATDVAPPVSGRTGGDAASGISVFTPPMHPSEAFPVAVTEVRGEEVVTGTRIATRYVDTEEMVRDQFGERKPKQELREFEVPEYAYRVTCAVENLTDARQDLTLRSGPGSLALSLAAREIATNVTLATTRGASLIVEAGSRVKSFPVQF
jgi:hypothetical protein